MGMTPAQGITIAISVISLILTIITVWTGLKKASKENADAQARAKAEEAAFQARMESKIEELTREVRKHNNFAERLPVLEEKMKVANHRIDDIEKKVD